MCQLMAQPILYQFRLLSQYNITTVDRIGAKCYLHPYRTHRCHIPSDRAQLSVFNRNEKIKNHSVLNGARTDSELHSVGPRIRKGVVLSPEGPEVGTNGAAVTKSITIYI